MSAQCQTIQLLLNGEEANITLENPTPTVLDYLRNKQRLIGTKEGCAEGDCGACTVVIGELIKGQLQLRTVNACLLLMPMLDGKAIFTVEYLRQNDGSLHPVQQAMVDHHGSQCGFCTPGFIMSLWSCYASHQTTGTRAELQELRSTLTGNLCRCTGYLPILNAGLAMFDLPPVSVDIAKITAQLQDIAIESSQTFNGVHSSFHTPKTLSDLVDLRKEHKDATLLAGCTDIGLWVNKQFRDLGDIIYVCEVPELKTVTTDPNVLKIGAAVSLTDAYAAVTKHYAELNEVWDRFASTPIRNSGTLGGNIANGSPIGDSMPWLIALGAMVELTGPLGARLIPLEKLYLGYMKNSMEADEIVSSVEIPLPTAELRFRCYKLAKRHDSDISAVCASFSIWLDGSTIKRARVAYGGMAATPKRADACETSLVGEIWNENTVRVAMQSLNEDFTPLDDMRASASYRTKTARNLLYRFYLETRLEDPMKSHTVRVFNSTSDQCTEAL